LNAWGRTWFDKTMAYTNHIIIPKALEKWPLDLLQNLLSCHVEIIETIDERVLFTMPYGK
jgi:starch phosphorylase